MNRERLKHLITILERVPPGRLKMDNWTCGTAACAAGHAAQDPVFNQQGFELRGTGSGRVPVLLLDTAPGADNPNNWDALEIFFGLHFDDVWRLFSSSAYTVNEKGEETYDPKPADVIARIRVLLAREELEDDVRAQVEDIEQTQEAAR
jgi:hypothetical protein